ncbi:MAG: rhomboid family intramembrane serine protease [Lachnospiraceae bacterium]|nr:rhomboid family intramembrane serine protease [Lachnospiraceae bacterium]
MSVRFLKDIHQWYRLVSSTFLHADMEHLVSNMLVLYCVGQMVEEVSSTGFSIAVYFGCGIAGNLASAFYEFYFHKYSLSIGASGAVFGYLGCFVAFLLFNRANSRQYSIPRVIGSVALSLYAGFSNTRVNNEAHIGGLAFGLIMGMVYCMIKERTSKNPWR